MAKKSENEPQVDLNVLSKTAMSNLLDKYKTLHWQYHENKPTKVSMGSLYLDSEIVLTEGVHRFCGPPGAGKTSEACEVVKNFFIDDPKKRKGLWVKSEGRLSQNIIERSGVKFVFKEEDWDYGTCFVLESNIFDFICNTIESMVSIFDNAGDKLIVVIDSADALRLEADMKKDLGDEKVAGPQLIMKKFLIRMTYPIQKSGAICIVTSQVSATINIDKYSKEPPKMTSGGGGNGLLHMANYILDFEGRRFGDFILEDDNAKFDAEKNKAIGHWASVVIRKTERENEMVKVKYPIKKGRTNGQSIWVEQEIFIFAKRWGLIDGTTWMAFEPNFLKKAQEDLKMEIKAKVQGRGNFIAYLEETPALTKYLFDKIKTVEGKE